MPLSSAVLCVHCLMPKRRIYCCDKCLDKMWIKEEQNLNIPFPCSIYAHSAPVSGEYGRLVRPWRVRSHLQTLGRPKAGTVTITLPQSQWAAAQMLQVKNMGLYSACCWAQIEDHTLPVILMNHKKLFSTQFGWLCPQTNLIFNEKAGMFVKIPWNPNLRREAKLILSWRCSFLLKVGTDVKREPLLIELFCNYI